MIIGLFLPFALFVYRRSYDRNGDFAFSSAIQSLKIIAAIALLIFAFYIISVNYAILLFYFAFIILVYNLISGWECPILSDSGRSLCILLMLEFVTSLFNLQMGIGNRGVLDPEFLGIEEDYTYTIQYLYSPRTFPAVWIFRRKQAESDSAGSDAIVELLLNPFGRRYHPDHLGYIFNISDNDNGFECLYRHASSRKISSSARRYLNNTINKDSLVVRLGGDLRWVMVAFSIIDTLINLAFFILVYTIFLKGFRQKEDPLSASERP